jgi:hypothetical protein
MRGGDGEDELILELREQSRRTVQAVFALLAALAIAVALGVRHYAGPLGLDLSEHDAIATCFLCMGISYVATVFIWEWMYSEDANEDAGEDF